MSEEERDMWDKISRVAERRGYKSGWVYHSFNEWKSKRKLAIQNK